MRFNGATAMKPWKRTVGVTVGGFNGATAMKPWKREPLTPEEPNESCFNGATAMKPWKSGIAIGRELGRGVASMGPRR